MGDRSPKNNQKHANQKQSKFSENQRKQQAAATAKQVVKTKK